MHILLVRQALQPFLPSKRRFLQAFASEFLCNTARDDGPYGRLSGEPRENNDPARVTSAAGCANGGNVRGDEPSVVRLMGQMVPHQRNAAPRETCRDIRENRKDMDGKPPQPEDILSSGRGVPLHSAACAGRGSALLRQLLITCAAGLDVFHGPLIQGVGLAGEVVLQGGEAVLSHEEGQQLFRVRLGGIQLEGILPLRCPAGVAAVELPAAALHRLLHLVLRAAHSWPRGPSGPSAATAGPMTSASAALTTCWPRTGT